MRVPSFIRQARQLPRTLLIAMCVAMGLLVGLGALSYQNIKEQGNASKWVAHTYQVQDALKDVFASIQGAESAQRMFTVSGVERYLQPCAEADRNLPNQLLRARDLLKDNPVQLSRLKGLQDDIEQRMRLVRTRIDQRRSLGAGALDPTLVNGEGVRLMDKVRADIAAMSADEDRLLTERQLAQQRARRRALWFQNVAGFVSLTLLAGVFITLAAQMLRAIRAEQEAQRSNTQLRDANNEMRAFSYSVAHDLRSPLRAINGFAEVLTDDCAGQLNDEGRRALGRITANATMMAQLIDDLLALSKISYQPLRAAKIDMTELARQAYDEVREPSSSGHVVECIINELPPASGDPSLLKQVWINLIGNALKFSGMRQKIEIEIGGNVAGPEFATYYIKDNGAGFDMQYASRLFGAFQRLHGVGEFDGTGIGLALVQRIIQRHGGAVWAEGQVDAGARFAFTLPEWTGE